MLLSNEDDLLICSAFAIPPPNVTLIFRNMIEVSYYRSYHASVQKVSCSPGVQNSHNFYAKLQAESVPSSNIIGGNVSAEFLFMSVPFPNFKEGGNLTCIATNEVGTTTRTVEVIVQRKWYCDVMMISLNITPSSMAHIRMWVCLSRH